MSHPTVGVVSLGEMQPRVCNSGDYQPTNICERNISSQGTDSGVVVRFVATLLANVDTIPSSKLVVSWVRCFPSWDLPDLLLFQLVGTV